MYDHLVGEVVDRSASRAVVRCAGVGYECRVSLTTSGQLRAGDTCTLFTILHVVDGTPSLLGFATRAERDLARRLLNVTNVGPSIALALLSVYEPRDLAGAIGNGDVDALKRVKGVGQKTAERLCLELRDAVHKLDLGERQAEGKSLPSQHTDDAIAALITLGYSEKDARDKVDRVRRRPDAKPTEDTESLVKAVLQM